MRFDARPGGQLVEVADDGSGVLWATVLAMDVGKSIDDIINLNEIVVDLELNGDGSMCDVISTHTQGRRVRSAVQGVTSPTRRSARASGSIVLGR